MIQNHHNIPDNDRKGHLYKDSQFNWIVFYKFELREIRPELSFHKILRNLPSVFIRWKRVQLRNK
jgi:hypothetical protein